METFIVNLLAVMVLLNFILNLTSVYLGRYKKHLLEDYLQHILEHLCPAYEDEDEYIEVEFCGEEEECQNASELAIKLSKDKSSFEMWDSATGEE